MASRTSGNSIQLQLSTLAFICGSCAALCLLAAFVPVDFKIPVLIGAATCALAAVVRVKSLRVRLRSEIENNVPTNWHELIKANPFQDSPIGFFLADGTDILLTNPSWDSLVGRRPEESPYEAVLRTAYLSDGELLKDALRTAAANQESVEIVLRHASSTSIVRHLRTFIMPVPDQNGLVAGHTIDVTDSVLAETEARRNQKERSDVQRLVRLSMSEMHESIGALVKVLVRAVEAKDPYTAGHSERVTAYAVAIGEAMGLCFDDLRTLEIGCLVHDIGKIGVPDSILTKRDSLTPDEYQAIAEHAAIGSDILADLPLFRGCLPIVRSHHERLDGSGYPDALVADEIPVIVRIAAVADAFDAMTSTRAYRQGIHPTEAIKELVADAERGRIDPQVVAVLADMVKREGVPDGLTAFRPSNDESDLEPQVNKPNVFKVFLGNEQAA